MIQLALLRRPSRTFAQGITEANLGVPDLALVLEQHGAYAQALRDQDIEVLILEPDDCYPDSCFVEDCAVIAGETLIWTRPGAESRRGEVDLLREQLDLDFDFLTIEEGTVDGGDVCQVEDRFLIGISARTNEHGAAALADHLKSLAFTPEIIDIRNTGLLHLKSGLSYLGDNRTITASSIADHPALAGLTKTIPDDSEAYAANAIQIAQKTILMPAGFPRLAAALGTQGLKLVEVDLSEFQKMDGGPSCLSLRFE